MLTKNQLLLRVAQHAVNWSEGSDFEFNELIHDSCGSEEMDAFEAHYPEFFPPEENEEDYDGNYLSDSDEFYSTVCGDINDLLERLIKAES
jgi:hypothetical protein